MSPKELKIRKEFFALMQMGMSSSDALAKVAKDNKVSWDIVIDIVGL